MKTFIDDIEKLSLENNFFRKVLFTTPHSQLVVMSLEPNEDIGEEVHKVDQFIRCEAGKGKAILDGEQFDISDGTAIIVPAGTKHNILNISPSKQLKLYTVYSPSNHRPNAVHKTKVEALLDKKDHSFEK